jgi:signal transduction histidine kinase
MPSALPPLTSGRRVALIVVAVAAGLGVAWVQLTSSHQEVRTLWAVFGPAVGWSFIGTGLYAWARFPESRIGVLMVLLGFAWFASTLEASDSPVVHTVSRITGALWGAVFLHLGVSFPSGRLTTRSDRAMVIAGYLIFPLSFLPWLLFATPESLGCPDCPDNVLLVRDDETLALAGRIVGALLYVGLFVVVVIRSVRYWKRATPFARLQLTPVYTCALLTFLLVIVAVAGAGDAAWWPAFVATALMPFAFLGGLLRTHVSRLDAELHRRLEELRASRARLVEAGDAERRRLERDLHDGAQSRLVGLSLLLRTARSRAGGDPDLASLLDRAQLELQTSLSELRELARGIHPAVLSEQGLEPALQALVGRVPVPVSVEADAHERLPEPIETAAYFVVSEALTNVAKYARASRATVAVRRANGKVTVEVADDGIGGADAARGSGLRGLADRLGALDGTLSLESPRGRGTRLRAEIPVADSGRGPAASARGDPG